MRIFYILLSTLVLLTSGLHAEVQLTTLTAPKVLDQPNEQIPLDIDGNGETDFIFFYDVYLGNPYLHINMSGNALYTSKVVVTGQKNIYGKDLVAVVPDGAGIGPSSKYNGPVLGNGPLLAQPSAAGADILEGDGEVYVGIRFVGSTGTHYGWIALEVNGDGTSTTMRAYAWETEIDTPIEAGEGRPVLIESIEVHPQEGTDTIDTRGGTLQMLADIIPSNATETDLEWSVDLPSVATIDDDGLLTAHMDGVVTVTARAIDGSGVEESIVIAVINQSIPVTGITVVGEKGDVTITEPAGTLQMIAEITPEDATNPEVTWSLSPEGRATIDENGLLTAVADGEVTVTATATDGSGVSGSTTILITSQPVAVTSITVRSESGATEITSDMGTLRLIADVKPTDATEKDVTWSVDDERIATITANGILTAIRNGTVVATATATDGSGVSGTISIDVSGQSTMSVSDVERIAGSLNLR